MPLEIKRYNNDQWGIFCHAKLDSGELIRIMIMYGPVTRLGMNLPNAPVELLVDTLRWGGLKRGYDILRYDLHPEEHAARMAQLPLVKRSDRQVSPLDAMIDYLKDCSTVVEVKQRCDAFTSLRLPAHWEDDDDDDDHDAEEELTAVEVPPSPPRPQATPRGTSLRPSMEFVLSLREALVHPALRTLAEGPTREMIQGNPALLLVPLEYETLKRVLCPKCGGHSWDSIVHASLAPRAELNWSHSIGGDYHECKCNGCGSVLTVTFWFSN